MTARCSVFMPMPMPRVMRFGLCLSLLAVPGPARAERRVVNLKDALVTADANLPALRQAAAETEVIAAQADEARATLLPQLNGTASYQRTTANYVPQPSITLGVTGNGTTTSTSSSLNSRPKPSSNTFNYWRFGATLTQTLFDAPSFAYWRSALASIGAQKAVWDTARLDAAYDVRLAFFSARANEALVDVAKETLDNQKRHLEQVQGFVDVGTRPEIDLAQSKSDVATARVQLITAQNNYDTSKATLNQAMGIAADTDYDLGAGTAEPIDLEDAGIEADVDAADKARPELKAFDDKVRAEILYRRSRYGTFAPVIGATFNISDSGADITNLGWNYYAQVGATWNFFGGLLNDSQIREANAKIASLAAQRSTERLQVRLELEKGRLAVRAAKESLIASREALENARIREQLAEGRYKAGVGNAIELADAVLAQASSSGQQIQAEFNLGTARSQLLRALGRR